MHSLRLPQTWGANHHTVILAPVPGATHLTSGCPRAGLPAEAPREGPPRLFQLLASLGIRPWAGGRLPPLSAFVSTCLSSSVSYKDPVPIQGGLISDPSLHHLGRDLVSQLSPVPRFWGGGSPWVCHYFGKRVQCSVSFFLSFFLFFFFCSLASVVSNSLRPHGLKPLRLLCSWDSPGKDTGVGCHFLL